MTAEQSRDDGETEFHIERGLAMPDGTDLSGCGKSVAAEAVRRGRRGGVGPEHDPFDVEFTTGRSLRSTMANAWSLSSTPGTIIDSETDSREGKNLDIPENWRIDLNFCTITGQTRPRRERHYHL